MSEAPREFGPFGTGKPVGPPRFGGFPVGKVLLLVLLLVAAPFGLRWAREFYQTFAEREPPRIQLIEPPPGIGRQPIALRFRISDRHSGLDEVIIRSEQAGSVQTLLRRSFEPGIKDETIALPINGQELGLREGSVRFQLIVFDRSFWSGSASTSVELPIDYTPPQVRVLTTQHNAVRGGVELVFYRLIADEDAFSGVTVGSHLFPGFPAKDLDPAFNAEPDVYFAFFAVPREFDESSENVLIQARDRVGNSSTASMFYRVRDAKAGERTVELSNHFMHEKLDQLHRGYVAMRERMDLPEPSALDTLEGAQRRLELFRRMNTDFRALIDEATRPLFIRPKNERYWSGTFGRPGGISLRIEFGELMKFAHDGATLGTYRSRGAYYRLARSEPVRACNDGVIIFAGDLGTYGSTVIVDHGFGLTTLYSHLEAIRKVEGDRVGKGEIIATAGDSGFTDGAKVGLEFRLHGVPVRPQEWWDTNWIADHIDQKVQSTKRRLGLRVAIPLG